MSSFLNTGFKISGIKISLFALGLFLILATLSYGFSHTISLGWTIALTLLFLLLITLAVRFYLKSLWDQRSKYIQKILEDKRRLDELIYLYEVVNKATHDVIWEYDIQADQLKWMQGFEETYGYTNDDCPSDFWSMTQVYVDDRAEIQQVLRNIIAEKANSWVVEYRYICADGTLKYVRDRGHVVFDTEGTPIRLIGAMQDVDRQHRYEQKLLSQNTQLREIAWINSHELRRPLSNILGLVELIKLQDHLPQEFEELIGMLSNSSQDLDNALKRINEQTKAE